MSLDTFGKGLPDNDYSQLARRRDTTQQRAVGSTIARGRENEIGMNPERVPYGADPSQFFELWHPERAASGFTVFVHGGFWRAKYDLSHANPFCAALAKEGIVIASLEYRRVGQPGSGWPGTFEDVVAGVKAATTHLGRTPVVVGHSAGGHLALRLSSEPVPLKAAVALAPVADLRLAHKLNLSNGAVVEFLNGTPEEMPSRYDEACSSRPSSIRRVLMHGTKDEDVPIEISRAFIEARQNDPERPGLVELPDAGHMDLIDPESPAGIIVLDLVARLARE
jgi:pimeloyl-ACP methyl ester carboxylesterase